MEIRIDTTKDSREDIKKAIRLLQSLVEGGSGPTESMGETFPSGENVLGGFFDSDTSSGASSSVSSGQSPPISGIPDDLGDKKEAKSKKFSIGSAGGFDVY